MTNANPTCRVRADLITFITDAFSAQDEGLMQGLLNCNSAEQIYQYFQQKGYKDVPLNDCKDILEACNRSHNKGVAQNGQCMEPDPGSGY